MNDRRRLVSVIIPAYNEEQQVTQTLQTVVDYLTTIEEAYRWEVLLIDDGSTDGTLGEARRFAAEHPGVRVVPHPANFNLGQALRYGFSLAEGDYLVTLDADLSYDCAHIGQLIEVLDTTRAKVVIASPYMEGGSVSGVPPLRLAASRMANGLLARAAKGHLTTVTGMVRAYDAVFLRRLDLKAMDVEINAEIIYKAQLMRATIVEVPARLTWTRDDSAVRPFRPSRSISGFAFVSFLFRPYAFFLIPSAAMLVVAIALSVMVVVSWAQGDVSLAAVVAAASSAVIAVMLGGMGVLSAQMKRYFEELFHLGTLSRSGPNHASGPR